MGGLRRHDDRVVGGGAKFHADVEATVLLVLCKFKSFVTINFGIRCALSDVRERLVQALGDRQVEVGVRFVLPEVEEHTRRVLPDRRVAALESRLRFRLEAPWAY